MGEMPDWYPLIQEAKYLNVAPWDLLERPIYWREWARMAAIAESEATKQKQARQTRKAKK